MQVNNGAVLSVIPIFSSNGRLIGSDEVSSNGYTYSGGAAFGTSGDGWGSVKIINPVGSTKIVIVDSVIVSTTLAGPVELMTDTTDVAGVNRLWYPSDPSFGAGVALIDYAVAHWTSTEKCGEYRLPADNIITIPLRFPFILRAGKNLTVNVGGGNSQMSVNFIGREITA